MPRDPKRAGENIKARVDKAQRTTEDATAKTAGDLDAARSKTTRLRAQRLEKEAREG